MAAKPKIIDIADLDRRVLARLPEPVQGLDVQMTEPAVVLARQLDVTREEITTSLNRLRRATLAEYTEAYSVRPSGWHLNRRGQRALAMANGRALLRVEMTAESGLMLSWARPPGA